MEKYQLKSIDEIFSETWALYKSRAIPILLVSLLSVLISSIVLVGGSAAAFIALGGQPYFTGDFREILLNPAVIGTAAALLLAAVFCITWCQAALLTITVRQERNSIRGLFTSWKYVFPLLWISSLYVGIITAGTLFFLLPGLILTLSMSLCFFIMVDEDRTGIDALLASRFYMRGHWWNTLFKFLPIYVLSVLISLIPKVGLTLSLLFLPFLLLYIVSVYRDLKECSGETAPSLGFGWCWVLFGVFGFFLPLLAFIGSIVALGPQLPDFIKRIELEVNRTLAAGSLPPIKAVQEGPVETTKIKTPRVRRIPSVDGFLVWRDPIGDTYTPFLDIKDVSAKGEQGELLLTVTVTRPLSDYFLTVEKETVDLLVSFYLDTDTDSTSGGAPFGQPQGRSGYDVDVQVQLVARQKEAKTKSVSGGIEVGLYRINGEERRSFGTSDTRDTRTEAVTVSGDTVTVRLPYSQLKVRPGDTLRMCYREAAQEQGQGLAEDKRVRLK